MVPTFFYFDLGKVLVDFDIQDMYRQMAAVAGVGPDRVREVLFGDGLETRYERGEISGGQFYEEFCRQTGTRPDHRSLEAAASDIFSLRPSMLPIVSQMRQAGYRLGVLSNTSQSHWEHCLRRYRILREAFETYALSYRIGHCKPEPAIYAAAAELAGAEPGEIFFTDDRPEHVAGARAAGFDAVPYTNTAELTAALRERGVRFNY
jgi:HAD superfamily hydrolase (TIGR01509 family)